MNLPNEAQPAEREPLAEMPRGRETILVVEDNPDLRDIAVDLLEGLGYTALSAEDGQAGLDLYHQQRSQIDLILLDLSLPGLSGRELLRRIRAVDEDLKIIVFTGEVVEESPIEGSDGLLQKPFRLADVEHTIRTVLDQP